MSQTVNYTAQTDKLCPFMGIPTINDLTNEITGIKCIKDACQLWVAKTPTNDAFTNITGTNDPDGLADPEDTIQGRCGAQVSDFTENLFRLAHHLHRHHQHPKGHLNCYEIPFGCGDPFFGLAMPTSMKMAMEFQTNEDQDGNGKIFGKDFGIISDEDTPNILLNLINPNRPYPKVLVKWKDIEANKFPPYYRNSYPNKLQYETGGWVRVTGGFFSGTLSNFVFTISSTENNTHTFSLGEDLIISSSTRLYINVPENFVTETRNIDYTITNDGNTFDMVGFNMFFNSGGTTSVKRAINLTDETVTDVQSQLIQEMLFGDNENSTDIDSTELSDYFSNNLTNSTYFSYYNPSNDDTSNIEYFNSVTLKSINENFMTNIVEIQFETTSFEYFFDTFKLGNFNTSHEFNIYTKIGTNSFDTLSVKNGFKLNVLSINRNDGPYKITFGLYFSKHPNHYTITKAKSVNEGTIDITNQNNYNYAFLHYTNPNNNFITQIDNINWSYTNNNFEVPFGRFNIPQSLSLTNFKDMSLYLKESELSSEYSSIVLTKSESILNTETDIKLSISGTTVLNG